MSHLLYAIVTVSVFLIAPAEINAMQVDTSRAGVQEANLRPSAQRGALMHPADPIFAGERAKGTYAEEGRKSPAGALLRSLGSTVVSTGLGTYLLHREGTPVRWIGGLVVTGGVLVGPSAGHFYARNEGQAWRGVMVRGGASVVAALAGWGAGYTFGQSCPASTPCREGDPTLGGILVGVLLGSAAAVLIRTVYDFATTWRAAERHNAARSFSARPTLNVTGEEVGSRCAGRSKNIIS